MVNCFNSLLGPQCIEINYDVNGDKGDRVGF